MVIAAHDSDGALEACLDSLAPQRDGAEVIVCAPQPSPPSLRERFDWARFVDCGGGRVPHLWEQGIRRSTGNIVAITNSTMVPASDWIEVLKAEHGDWDAVAGAIDPGAALRVSDWAEYFCRYSSDMLPFDGHECEDLPGDNASYKREMLERTEHSYRDGFWEPEVHRSMLAQGARLWHSPALVVRQGRSGGVRAFTRQRLAHGRAHGAQRGARFGVARNVAGVMAAPLVGSLLTARILRAVSARGRMRGRAILALPLILLFNVAWSLGEARGHLDVLRRR